MIVSAGFIGAYTEKHLVDRGDINDYYVELKYGRFAECDLAKSWLA